MTFTAIDFETAQAKRHSICQVGIVQITDGIIRKKVCELVKPPDNFFSSFNIRIHGITSDMTRNAPTFKTLWPKLKPYISGKLVVAHNASFDISCLHQTLNYYKIALPEFTHDCTYKIYKAKLSECCNKYSIPLTHHDALSDALACAQLYMRYKRGK